MMCKSRKASWTPSAWSWRDSTAGEVGSCWQAVDVDVSVTGDLLI
jgi:hypothetical protein